MESRESRGPAGGAAGLLERERELELLTGALERAAEGDAGIVVIKGDAGLGKSSLLECTSQLARDCQFEVLRARGGSLERTLGWGVARQLFEARVARAATAERRSLLRRSASLAAPVLGLVAAGEDEQSPVKDFHFEHGLYWLVCNLVERAPLALLIDDVQWCDDATLEWLLYLVRRSERLPLLVVVATRPGEPGAPTALLELVAAEPVARTHELSALGEAATETLLERAYGSTVDHEFGVAFHLRTGGNPLFVTELAAELAAEGVDPVASATSRVRTLTPEGVSRVTVLRLARLSESALELARAAAVLEPAAELRYASDLAGLAEGAAATAFDELVEARVLSAAHPLTFVHPLIGSVVYDDLPPARRAMMHKRAARLLVGESEEAGRVAAHLLRTARGGDRWVVDELRIAAERELARGSPSTAAQLLRRARSEPPAVEALAGLLLELGRAESLSGEKAGVQTLRAAMAASTDARQRGEIAHYSWVACCCGAAIPARQSTRRGPWRTN